MQSPCQGEIGTGQDGSETTLLFQEGTSRKTTPRPKYLEIPVEGELSYSASVAFLLICVLIKGVSG